jgi:stage IV sporulation protein FB
MFLAEPERTQFDLRFRLGSVPVRVHPFFWVMSLAMGWNLKVLGLEYVLLWVVCVFVPILFHELGHVVAGQWFGSSGHIVLYSFGGLAVGSNQLSQRWQRIVVCAAGPAANFLLVALLIVVLVPFRPDLSAYLWQSVLSYVWLADEPFLPGVTLMNVAVEELVWINAVWGAVNLLPVWPLDGGQISRDLFTGSMGPRGVRVSLIVSIVIAAVIAVNSLAKHLGYPLIPYIFAGTLYTAIFFGLLAGSNVMELQQGQQRRRMFEEEERLPWERDADWWKSGKRPYDD